MIGHSRGIGWTWRTALRQVRQVVLAAAALAVLGAWPPSAAAGPLEDARQLYDEGKFQEAVQALERALADGTIPRGEVTRARELLARSHVKAGNRVQARETFKLILTEDPGYQADVVHIPPDELEVYNQVLKEVIAEQIEAGRRIPASIALEVGTGSAGNSDLADIAALKGGEDSYESQGEFAFSVRFPLRPRLSMDLQFLRLLATNHDALTGPDPSDAMIVPVSYKVSALPLTASLLYTAIPGNRMRLNVFGGGGPLLVASSDMRITHDHGVLIPVNLSSRTTGTYLHAGAEGEYLLTRRFAATVRGLLRYAKTGELEFDRPDFQVYGGFAQSSPESRLGGRAIDFSGYQIGVGLRAYIGY